MTTTETGDNSATLDELTNLGVSYGARISSNNEEVKLYPDAPGAEYGVIKHMYEGFPAQGVILYDVTGFEIVGYDFEQHEPDDLTMEEEFENFRSEIVEWIGGVLKHTGPTGMTDPQANMFHEGPHRIRLVNPWEGDEYTIELTTKNKRRVR